MGEREGRIAYIIGVFPSLTETFIVREVLELRRRGLSIDLFSLTTPREKVVHPEAQALRQETIYSPFFLSWDLWKAQLYYLWRSPWSYLSLWWDVARHSFREPWVLARSWAAIPKSVRFARIIECSDVVHLHGHMCTFGALGAMVVSRLTGIPYSFTAHGLHVYSGNPMLPEKARRAEFVVCVSRFIQRFIKSLCPEISLERSVVRHYGVDLETYHPPTVPPANSRPIILCVAGLKPWKGVRDLVQAVGILRQDGFSFECWHVGEGPEEGRIRAQVTRLGLEGFFLMKGPMAQTDLFPFMGRRTFPFFRAESRDCRCRSWKRWPVVSLLWPAISMVSLS